MSKYLLVLLILAFSFPLWVSDVEIELEKKAFRKLHYALDHAAHDATLFIEPQSYANGVIDFNEIKAKEVVIQTLRRNLAVDENLDPLHTYYFKDQINLIQELYIDENYIDPDTGTTVTFPYTYSYDQDGYNFSRVVLDHPLFLWQKRK
jgi:hypothetical protein